MHATLSSRSLRRLAVVDPALPATVNPKSLLFNAVLVYIVADTALLAAVPAALILAAVAPNEFALAMALVLLELAHVLLAVRPN